MNSLKEFIELETRVGTDVAMRLLGCSYQHLLDLIKDDPDMPQPMKNPTRLSWTLRELTEYVEIRKRKTRVEREAFRKKRRKEFTKRSTPLRRKAK